MEPIEKPDTSNLDPKYWDKVLKSHGLGVNAGAVPSRKVSFIGGINNLVGKEEEEYRKESGKVDPNGHGPDD